MRCCAVLALFTIKSKKNIRDDDVFLLLTSQSEPYAHRDETVCESEKHPFYALVLSVRM